MTVRAHTLRRALSVFRRSNRPFRAYALSRGQPRPHAEKRVLRNANNRSPFSAVSRPMSDRNGILRSSCNSLRITLATASWLNSTPAFANPRATRATSVPVPSGAIGLDAGASQAPWRESRAPCEDSVSPRASPRFPRRLSVQGRRRAAPSMNRALLYCGSHFVRSAASCSRPSSSELNSATTSRPCPTMKVGAIHDRRRAARRNDRNIVRQPLSARSLQQT